MIRRGLVDGWRFRARHAGSDGDDQAEEVTVPHDAIISTARRDDLELRATGYFAGGAWEYARVIDAPEQWRERTVLLEFEAVYRSAAVYVNGDLVGHRPSGYATFSVCLDGYLRYGAANTIRVEARAHRDSRWYSRGSLIRPVWLVVADPVHIALDGVTVTTPDIDDQYAMIEIDTTLENGGRLASTRRLRTRILDPEGLEVATDEIPVTTLPGEDAIAHQRLLISRPQRWSLESPRALPGRVDSAGRRPGPRQRLHGVRHSASDARPRARLADQRRDGEAARRVRAPRQRDHRGHDDRSSRAPPCRDPESSRVQRHPQRSPADESRDARGLRSAGRVGHGRADRHVDANQARLRGRPGLSRLVARRPRRDGPEGSQPPERLRVFDRQRDPRDRNRSRRSVGAATRHRDAGARCDPLRHEWRERSPPRHGRRDRRRQRGPRRMGARRGHRDQRHDGLAGGADERARCLFRPNLPDRRAARRARHRGSELSGLAILARSGGVPPPRDRGVRDVPDAHRRTVGIRPGQRPRDRGLHVDRHGLSRRAGNRATALCRSRQCGGALANYPWIASWAGDIDITGRRRPASYYRAIVFGLRSAPYIAVRNPETSGRERKPAPWSWTDSSASWTWPGSEGEPVEIEVYSDADEVELFVNGVSAGTVPCGPAHRYRAVFAAAYEPGTVKAVAHREGRPGESTSLRTAGPFRRLVITPDSARITANDGDLVYLDIEVVDEQGTLAVDDEELLEIEVSGVGRLRGFGSAAPLTSESYADERHRAFRGHALAVVQPTCPGRIDVTVRGEHVGVATTPVDVDPN